MNSETEDPEVCKEEERVLREISSGIINDPLLVMDLTKSYRNLFAVDNLTFGLKRKECLGLLGVNGAGKTTAFRMLTGDCVPIGGNAFAKNCSLTTNPEKFLSLIGYCPQFDPIIDRLTGSELLMLFGKLRGLSKQALKQSVEQLIRMTDLMEDAHKQTRFYSGGTKRKLSIAISLIGSPKIILLDEPTAGVDPISRRKIWTILKQVQKDAGVSIIITSHSMEECEALCSRLAIMVNGRLECLGSIQQIKSRFGQGCSIKIKMKRETLDSPNAVLKIQEHIKHNLNGAKLIDYHQGIMEYHVEDQNARLSYLFQFMEDAKEMFKLEDFLIRDTSLEQIFLSFARTQQVRA